MPVLLVSKAPRPGLVKTRLSTMLGDQGCAELQRELIRNAVDVAFKAAVGEVFIAYSPNDATSEMKEIAPTAIGFPQSEGDLGERLKNAVIQVSELDSSPIIVIGADIPTLNSDHLQSVIPLLLDRYDCVLGPAVDGGYYLIAFRDPLVRLFDLPTDEWSGPNVRDLTLAIAQQNGYSVALLPTLRDLDTPEDARLLVDEGNLPCGILRVLVSAGAGGGRK